MRAALATLLLLMLVASHASRLGPVVARRHAAFRLPRARSLVSSALQPEPQPDHPAEMGRGKEPPRHHSWEQVETAVDVSAATSLAGRSPSAADAAADGQTIRALLGASSASSSATAQSSDASRTTAEISALFKSRAVKGVGPKLAAALLTRFGERTLDVLRGRGRPGDEAELLDVPGVGPKTLERIRSSVETWESLREALAFSRTLGVLSDAQVAHLVSVHGPRTEAAVRGNPYLLLDLFPGLRFTAVDALARGEVLGVEAGAMARA
jgi:DNA uptake protein ComE-like DNA-binding protein